MSKPLLSRADHKRIKNMNREQLSDYLNRVWRRGFEVGLNTKAVPKTEAEENTSSKTVGEE